MSGWIRDLRHAARALLVRPAHLIVVVAVLSVAIGANSTIFSLLSAYVLRPLPYPDSDRLVAIQNVYPNMGLEAAAVSIPDYLDRREQAPSLESSALYLMMRRLMDGGERPEQLLLTQATPSLFEVLRTGPALGRAFTEAEAVPGQDRVAVISHRLWTSRFGARAGVVGEDVRLDGELFRILGVMPEGFGFPNEAVDAWVPFAFTPEQMADDQRGMEFSRSIGRLADGATIAGLNAEMDAIVQRSLERLSARRSFIESSGFTGRAQNLHDLLTRDARVLLTILQGLVFAVLLIACANIANLQLARTAARRKELSVRAALGAGRARLARLVLSESAVLSMLGVAGGLGLCYAGTEFLSGLMPGAPTGEVGINSDVVVFSIFAALLTTIATGLFPVLAASRDNLSHVVQDSSRVGGGLGGQRARGALIVFQVAASVALLVSAGLLAKSFYRLVDVDPGFESNGAWTAGVVLPREQYSDNASIAGFYTQALERLGALPGVTAAGFTSSLPLSGNASQGSYAIDGYVPEDGVAPPHAHQRSVSEGYFAAIGATLLQGRNFAATEPEPVVIVDEVFASRYFPGGNAIGQRVTINLDGANTVWSTVIGVVPAIHHESLAVVPTKETIYWHYTQQTRAGGQIVLRTSLPPEQLTPVVTSAVSSIDRDVVLADAMTVNALVMQSLAPQSAAMRLTILFALGAVALAVLGIYGVLTWTVTQRVGEIGVRIALGAKNGDIVAMVLRQGGRYVATGAAVGVALAAAIGFALSAEIHEVSPLDPAVFAIALVTIMLTAFAASWLPARRAAAVDPMVSLRNG